MSRGSRFLAIKRKAIFGLWAKRCRRETILMQWLCINTKLPKQKPTKMAAKIFRFHLFKYNFCCFRFIYLTNRRRLTPTPPLSHLEMQPRSIQCKPLTAPSPRNNEQTKRLKTDFVVRLKRESKWKQIELKWGREWLDLASELSFWHFQSHGVVTINKQNCEYFLLVCV